MNLRSHIHSLANEVLFRLRNTLCFRRGGYKDRNSLHWPTPPEAQSIEKRYKMEALKAQLNSFHYRRNLATLWYLESINADQIALPARAHIVEPGCQDFSRLPAWRAFFGKEGELRLFHGVEIDAFPVLDDLHSRWDRAHYYMSLGIKEPSADAQYSARNFFDFKEPVDLVICFYPFVSVRPALAWGLPARFASSELWLTAIDRCLQSGGEALVIHQGAEEEMVWDQARTRFARLELVERKVLACPFYDHPHPVCASRYRKLAT